MKYYCGLDISLKNTSICVVNQNGDIIKEGETLTDPEAIHLFFKKLSVPIERAGIEASSLTPWVCQELLRLGWPAICIETRHAKAALSAQQVKTDRNDARGLAHIMRTGWYKEVHVKSRESHRLRILLKNRRFLLDSRCDLDSQIRGTIKVFGLKVGRTTEFRYESRIMELTQGDPLLRSYIEPMLEVRRQLIIQYKALEKIILRYVRQDAVCRRLMTVPGIGPLTSLAFKTFVDRPERFKKSRSVGAALGLTPKKYASGETDYDGRITKCGDPFVRQHLFEAANSLMGRYRGDTPLKSWGLKIAERGSRKRACVAVSRKLAVLMIAIWRDGTTFQHGAIPLSQTIAA